MESISALYRLKEDSKTGKKFGSPDRYLGATAGTHKFKGVGSCWYMSSDGHVAESVKNVEIQRYLKTQIPTPMAVGNRPKLDVSSLLSDEQANYYQT
jgi:hypothetical protein